MYGLEIKPSCRNEIVKASKKNPVLKKAIENKINEILLSSAHYKPLRYDFARNLGNQIGNNHEP